MKPQNLKQQQEELEDNYKKSEHSELKIFCNGCINQLKQDKLLFEEFVRKLKEFEEKWGINNLKIFREQLKVQIEKLSQEVLG